MEKPATSIQVLIVGAGPTGLVLAICLKKLGIQLRIIDKNIRPGTTSRAIVMHARTLEFYQQLEIASEVVQQGLKFNAINMWAKGKHKGRVSLGDIGEGLGPFPYMLIYPQDEHEKFLIEKLKELGVSVERQTELLSFHEEGEIVTLLRHRDGREEVCRADFIAGCDGAHSSVRKVLQMEFAGATYSRLFYVADIVAEGPIVNNELHIALDEADFLAVFPLKGQGQLRFIGTVNRTHESDPDPTWDDVKSLPLTRLNLKVNKVNWFSTYHVHHRLADSFRRGRAFLLGDAAHIHSPVGGQGMNTGIGDAVNLSWKLAAVLQKKMRPTILDSYEQERRAFAERLVSTTDRVFTFVTNDGPIARWMRLEVVPRILPRLLTTKLARKFFFQTVSQIGINYRTSTISEGQSKKLHSGDRLPWTGENYESLIGMNWQLHIYGDADEELKKLCQAKGLVIHTFAWKSAYAKKGLDNKFAYLVRPDGYIGFVFQKSDTEELRGYVNKYWA